MNNEEKILEMLGQMQGELGQMRGELGQTQGELGQMRGELGQMRGELKNLKTSQAVMERETKDVKSYQQMLTVAQDKLGRGQAVIEQGQSAILTRIDALEEGQQVIRDSQLKVELEQFPRIAAALDGFANSEKKNEEQDQRISAIARDVDKHDTRIWTLEQRVKTK